MLHIFPIEAVAIAGAAADGFGGHRHGRRQGRRQQFPRRGRNDAAAAAPLGGYGVDDAGALDSYVGAGSEFADDALAEGDSNLAMLEKSVPGVPGEDYPIYSEVPETAFVCDGQVDGGECFILLASICIQQQCLTILT